MLEPRSKPSRDDATPERGNDKRESGDHSRRIREQSDAPVYAPFVRQSSASRCVPMRFYPGVMSGADEPRNRLVMRFIALSRALKRYRGGGLEPPTYGFGDPAEALNHAWDLAHTVLTAPVTETRISVSGRKRVLARQRPPRRRDTPRPSRPPAASRRFATDDSRTGTCRRRASRRAPFRTDRSARHRGR
jgi:hypothetical protein